MELPLAHFFSNATDCLYLCLLLQGLDSGYGAGEDESYNVYDKPWRQDNDLSSIYRPSKNIDKDLYGDDLDKIIKSNRWDSCQSL